MFRKKFKSLIQMNLAGTLFALSLLSGISVFAANENIDSKIVQDDNIYITNYYE